MSLESTVRQLEIEIDNYHVTVLALRALANVILFDESTRRLRPGGSAHCGRCFRTSHTNKQAANTDVHPDLAIVCGKGYGVVAEAKVGFESEEHAFHKRIEETVQQLQKYDDDLTGWPREASGQEAPFCHDLALVVNCEDAGRALRSLKEEITQGSMVLARTFGIVSIARLLRSHGVWPMLKLEYGGLSDSAKAQRLGDGIPINPEILDASPVFGQIRVYDYEPPLPFMMALVHQAVVSNLTVDESEMYTLDGQVDKEVSWSVLQNWLLAYAFKKADERDPLIPKLEWVQKGVAGLVDLGWVTKAGADQERFIYHHKRGRKGSSNPLGRFIDICAKLVNKAEEKKRREMAREEKRQSKSRERLKQRMPLFATEIEQGCASRRGVVASGEDVQKKKARDDVR